MADDSKIRSEVNPSFRFLVEVEGQKMAAFTECTLPAIEWDVEEIKEGGLNTYAHQLPGRRKAGKISLKKGVGKSVLVDWYLECMSETFTRKSVVIQLLDLTHQPVITWNLAAAYPVKWAGPELKTDANTVAIQTLDLACGEITVTMA